MVVNLKGKLELILIINVLFFIVSCNSKHSKDFGTNNKMYALEKCRRDSILYNNLIKKGNVFFNVLKNRDGYNQRVKDILEDEYGVFVFYGSDICECENLNNQIKFSFNKLVNNELMRKIKHKSDSLNQIYDPMYYSKDGIPTSYNQPPIFKGTKNKFDSLRNLDYFECLAEYENDTFFSTYKLFLDINGNIICKKALVKCGEYWDRIINNIIDEKIKFEPANKISKTGNLYKVPSIVYLNFGRRWGQKNTTRQVINFRNNISFIVYFQNIQV